MVLSLYHPPLVKGKMASETVFTGGGWSSEKPLVPQRFRFTIPPCASLTVWGRMKSEIVK